jgi:hypothetical protein
MYLAVFSVTNTMEGVLIDKVLVVYVVTLPTFYGTDRCNTMFTRTLH